MDQFKEKLEPLPEPVGLSQRTFLWEHITIERKSNQELRKRSYLQ